MYLKIANKGIMEPEALTMMGASTKDGISTIGEFGSGNKYALAYLLRNNYNLIIQAGTKRVTIDKQPKVFRGKDFNVICIDGKETSLTCEMGKDWKLWQAIRELYCNAVDEGITAFDLVDSIPETDPEETAVFIKTTPELEQLYFNIDDYIAKDKVVLFENENGKIYRKHGSKAVIYRKGIRVYETESDSIFDYDLPKIHINESRVVEYSWNVGEQMWKLLFSCDNIFIVRTILQNITPHLFENQIDNSMCSITTDVGDTWVAALDGKEIAPRSMGGYLNDEDRPTTILLPDVLYNRLAAKENRLQSRRFKACKKGLYLEATPSELHNQILKDCLYFLKECSFEIPYEIEVVQFTDASVFGTIREDRILLGTNALDKGKHFVVNTIIEEYIHLKYEVRDCTRSFQDAAIDILVNYMKLKNVFTL